MIINPIVPGDHIAARCSTGTKACHKLIIKTWAVEIVIIGRQHSCWCFTTGRKVTTAYGGTLMEASYSHPSFNYFILVFPQSSVVLASMAGHTSAIAIMDNNSPGLWQQHYHIAFVDFAECCLRGHPSCEECYYSIPFHKHLHPYWMEGA